MQEQQSSKSTSDGCGCLQLLMRQQPGIVMVPHLLCNDALTL